MQIPHLCISFQINNLAPEYLLDILTISNNKNYNLRSIKRKYITLPSQIETYYMKYTCIYYCTRTWNNIHVDIQNSNSLNASNRNYYRKLFEFSFEKVSV